MERNRQYFEKLLKQVEQDRREDAAKRQNELLSEDPLEKNYARWATEDEMKESLQAIPRKAKEVKAAGVPMLCKEDEVYVDTSDSHSLIIGASGSKKTRLFILPTIYNLMKAGESIIVTDPKAELYERTSGKLRENGYEVLCINFRDDARQNCWNPLKAPREFFQNGKFDLAVGLLNDFSTIAVPSNKNSIDTFWDDSARSAFMGLLLMMFLLAEDMEEINIRGLLRMRNVLFNAADVKNSLFQELYKYMDPGSLVASHLSSIAVVPEKTLGSILGTLDTHLLKFIMRPDLTDMLCHDDMDFHAMGHEKTAVFLVMPDEKETYHGLISIFIQQCYESLIFEAQKLPGKTLPRRVNFLLDEFSSLPPIQNFPSMISAARSRNIRFNIVIQSEKQLRSRYKDEAETIKGNCNNWLFLYSRELESLEEICRLCGSQKSGSPLITPSRLQRLDKQKGEVLIIHGRNYPFIAYLDDVNVYDNEEFLPAYCKVTEERELRVLKIDELCKQHEGKWFEAKFAQNTVRQAEIEEMEKQKRLEEEQLAAKARLENCVKVVDWLPFSNVPVEMDSIYQASKKWYEKTYPNQPESLWGYECTVCENEETQNVMLPKGTFPLNYVSVVSETNLQSIALIGEDGDILSEAAHHVYRRSLAAGQVVPIYFNMEEMRSDWNVVVSKYKKDETTLLYLLLAKQLFGIEMPKETDEELTEEVLCTSKVFLDAFSQEPDGMPRYLVILDRLDLADHAFDAVFQSANVCAMPNVRTFMTTTVSELLYENCANYTRKTKYNIWQKDNPPEHSHVMKLYFDESTNEVKAEQGEMPAIQLEVSKCSQS